MQPMAMAIVGLVCLMTCLVSFYKLVPRQGRQTIRWMKFESVEILVTLVLVTLLALGASFLFAALV